MAEPMTDGAPPVPDDPSIDAARPDGAGGDGTLTGPPDLLAPDEAVPVTRARRRQRTRRRNTIEWVLVIVGAILVAVVVRTFFLQAFRIPSASMYPTLKVNDRVVVNKLSYKLHDIHRGDVVVFDRPANLPAAPGDPDDLIKRVIGLPGESVVAKNGSVYIDNRKLSEPYLPKSVSTLNFDKPITVPAGDVFVMGDNREDSTDSRKFGPIAQDEIVGRAFMRIWPLSRIGSL